jgi:hypothetical protein
MKTIHDKTLLITVAGRSIGKAIVANPAITPDFDYFVEA